MSVSGARSTSPGHTIVPSWARAWRKAASSSLIRSKTGPRRRSVRSRSTTVPSLRVSRTTRPSRGSARVISSIGVDASEGLDPRQRLAIPGAHPVVIELETVDGDPLHEQREGPRRKRPGQDLRRADRHAQGLGSVPGVDMRWVMVVEVHRHHDPEEARDFRHGQRLLKAPYLEIASTLPRRRWPGGRGRAGGPGRGGPRLGRVGRSAAGAGRQARTRSPGRGRSSGAGGRG